MKTTINKRVAKSILISLCIITIPPLLVLINIYTDLYPNSNVIQIKKPGTLNYSDNSTYGEKSCKVFYWGVEAQTNSGQKTLLEYYSKRWNQAGYWGGTDTYNVFTIVGVKYGIFIIKYIQTPSLDNHSLNDNDTPLTYVEGSWIEFCKVQNLILNWTDS